MWIVVGIVGAVVGVAVLGAGVWLLVPTLRTFRGPEFEPAAQDGASVTRALQSGTSAGAGSAGI